MGPKLFNVYVNDLPNVSDKVEFVLFADDSNFMLSSANPKELEKSLNRELRDIKDYFDSNGLSINTEKTTYLQFCPKNKKRAILKISLGDYELKEKEQTTFLGIIIDNKLSFKYHFDKVYKKVKTGLNGLILSRNFLNYRAKLNIYNSLIHSHLIYGAIIWISNISKKNLKSLQTLQKKALRAVFKKKYNAHTDNLFYKANITKVENIFTKESLLLMYKHENKTLPLETSKLIDTHLEGTQETSNNIQTYLERPTILTRSRKKIEYKPKRGISKGNTLFDIIENWNKNSKDLQTDFNISTFKKLIVKTQNTFTACSIANCYSCNN